MQTQTKILTNTLLGPNNRFRIQKFQTRFGTIEYFGFDAADITDAEVREGRLIEPFAQGNYMQVRTAITQRLKQRP